MLKTYTILTGRGRGDSRNRVTKVLCEENDIRLVATAVYRGARTDYDMPIACVVKEGEGVTNSDFDIMIADCM